MELLKVNQESHALTDNALFEDEVLIVTKNIIIECMDKLTMY